MSPGMTDRSPLRGALPSASIRRRVGKAIRRLVQLGVRFECPLCGATVRAFQPLEADHQARLRAAGFSHSLGDFETLNVAAYRCPVCREPDRSRLFALYVRMRLSRRDAGERSVLLDVAPSRELSRWLQGQPRVRYVSTDIGMNGVSVRASLTTLPLASESVDAFICSHVLEHVPNQHGALAELYRVLRPGGWGIAMVPILLTLSRTIEMPESASENDRWRLVGQGDHVRLHCRTDFVEALCRAGFTVQQLGAGTFGQEAFNRHGISVKSVLYVVEKAK